MEYLAVVVGIFFLRYGQNYLLNRAGQQAMHDLRVELFEHIQRLSLSFFDRNPVGRLMTRLTNDVDSLNELLTSGGLMILSDAITILGIAVALLLLNWPLALITFLVIPPLMLLTGFVRAGMRSSFRAVRIRLARVNATIAENIDGDNNTGLGFDALVHNTHGSSNTATGFASMGQNTTGSGPQFSIFFDEIQSLDDTLTIHGDTEYSLSGFCKPLLNKAKLHLIFTIRNIQPIALETLAESLIKRVIQSVQDVLLSFSLCPANISPAPWGVGLICLPN